MEASLAVMCPEVRVRDVRGRGVVGCWGVLCAFEHVDSTPVKSFPKTDHFCPISTTNYPKLPGAPVESG